MSQARLRLIAAAEPDVDEHVLDGVFAALSDPVRRAILMHLEDSDLLVSQIAQRFDISLQAVSRHIQVLVRAGLIRQERTGRISRCRLDTGPIFTAAVWLNRYSKYWQEQFDLLAAALGDVNAPTGSTRPRPRKRRHGAARKPAKST